MSTSALTQALTEIANHSYTSWADFKRCLDKLAFAAQADKTDRFAQEIFSTFRLLGETGKLEPFATYIHQLLNHKPRDAEGVKKLFLAPLGISQFHLPPIMRMVSPDAPLTPLEEPFRLLPDGTVVKIIYTHTIGE